MRGVFVLGFSFGGLCYEWLRAGVAPSLKDSKVFYWGSTYANLTKFTVTRKQFDVCFHYTIMPCGDVHDLCAASGCCIQLKHSGKESAFRNPCEAYFHAN